MIKLRFETVDGIRKTKKFKTLAGARKAAWDWVGKDADVGRWYAVSVDGVVKVMADGCTLAELFAVKPVGMEEFFLSGVSYPTFAAAKAAMDKMLADGYYDGEDCIEAYRWDGTGYVAAPELIPTPPPRKIADDEIPF